MTACWGVRGEIEGAGRGRGCTRRGLRGEGRYPPLAVAHLCHPSRYYSLLLLLLYPRVAVVLRVS